jgi:Fic family protein
VKIPLTPPPLDEIMNSPDIERVFASAVDDAQYLHWTDLFHRSPPAGHTHRSWWAALKLGRGMRATRIPLKPVKGPPFTLNVPDAAWEMLVKIDQQTAGRIGTSDTVVNAATRDKYVMSSLIEEAITSSQLEGASTSRPVAKEMLRTGRPPKDRSEQMILNNFHAMEFVREHCHQPLTPDLVVAIQRVITEGTLDDPADVGRVQQPDDERVSVCDELGNVLHVPPPAADLPRRLAAMCDFANGGGKRYVHPVVRAVLLHFWLGYDHPFADGNGRTARALFYWSMLRDGYWLAEFISISTILRKAYGQYPRSFLLTETDDNDLTYFVLYHLRVIVRAVEALMTYAERKAHETREVERLFKSAARYNHRQLALLSHALRNADATYTIESHRRSHGVVYQTARSDLLELAEARLLTQRKDGKAYRFTPSPELRELLG